jgi:hypothetical protein
LVVDRHASVFVAGFYEAMWLAAIGLGLQQPLELVACHLLILENFAQQTDPNRLARVHRNDGGPSVGMLKKVMTPLRPNDRERRTPQRTDHLLFPQPW